MKILCIITVLFPVFLTSQEINSLKAFEFLIGNWQGVEGGVAGDGIGFRSYTWELNKNYIMHKNASHFPRSDKKPRGEVHRDIAVMSYNSNDSSVVLREFHVEGFTNIYLLDKLQSNDSTFTFVTREIENNPANWKARLTLKKVSKSEFTEIFEITGENGKFKEWLRNHWYKVD